MVINIGDALVSPVLLFRIPESLTSRGDLFNGLGNTKSPIGELGGWIDLKSRLGNILDELLDGMLLSLDHSILFTLFLFLFHSICVYDAHTLFDKVMDSMLLNEFVVQSRDLECQLQFL